MPSLLSLVRSDLRRKAKWCYDSDRRAARLKVLLTDGTTAMLLYRLMQWSRRWRLAPLEMIFNKLNAVCCNCIIGRGADFGPGFVLIHSTGIVINGGVQGGENVYLEHQVTIGAERRQAPVLGSGVFVGAGAKIIGPITIGDGARVGANAVVVDDVPANCTVVGIPAKVVRRRASGDDPARPLPSPDAVDSAAGAETSAAARTAAAAASNPSATAADRDAGSKVGPERGIL
jgi:serine O-acetyltransferase